MEYLFASACVCNFLFNKSAKEKGIEAENALEKQLKSLPVAGEQINKMWYILWHNSQAIWLVSYAGNVR